MHRHASCLSDAGYKIILVGRELPHSIPLKEMNFEQKRLTCWFQKGKLFYIEFQIRLFFCLLFLPKANLVAVDLDTLLPNFIVSKIKGVKLVHDAHEYFVEVPEVTNRPLTSFFWDAIGKACIVHCHLAYTVGEELAIELSNRYEKKFECIKNLPLLINEIRALNSNSDLPVVLYQGALNEGRALENLILAMHQVPAILWIVGEGDLSKQLRNLVIQEQLTSKVKFLGFVAPNELRKITKQAYIAYNLLEPKGLSYQFSLANKFFDYIHAEVPQLCANFISYQRINEKYKVALLLNADINSIVNALHLLLNDSVLYNELKANCKKAAQVYNLQNESKALLQYYNQLCS